MAKKTRLYEATTRNGHGTKTQLFVAQTKSHLKKVLETKNVKVEDIHSLGFKTVSVTSDYEDRILFQIGDDESLKLEIYEEDLGHKLLSNKFQPQVDNEKAQIKRRHEEEFEN